MKPQGQPMFPPGLYTAALEKVSEPPRQGWVSVLRSGFSLLSSSLQLHAPISFHLRGSRIQPFFEKASRNQPGIQGECGLHHFQRKFGLLSGTPAWLSAGACPALLCTLILTACGLALCCGTSFHRTPARTVLHLIVNSLLPVLGILLPVLHLQCNLSCHLSGLP